MLYCNFCEYSAVSNKDLNKHVIRRHTKDEDIDWKECNECDKKFKTDEDVYKHIRQVHTKDEDIDWKKCNECDKKFKTNEELKSHEIFLHTKDEDIDWKECNECDKKFKMNSDLIKHILFLHTKDEDIDWKECNKCDKKYKTKKLLKQHILYCHTKDEDIDWKECNECDKKFKLSGGLKRHILFCHTKDEDVYKWYKCGEENCEEKFKTGTEVKRHLEIKHDIGNHKCEFCLGNRFSSIIYKESNKKHKICRNCYNKVTGKNSRMETDMSNYLDEKYGIEHLLKTDQTIKGNTCSRYRPDKLYASPGFVLQIECDEFQHKKENGNYSCDEKRISDIYDEFPGNKYIVIRWNPHTYKTTEKRLDKKQRLNLLLKTIKFITENLSKLPQIFIIYMFYDSDNPRISKNIPNKFIYTENDLKI